MKSLKAHLTTLHLHAIKIGKDICRFFLLSAKSVATTGIGLITKLHWYFYRKLPRFIDSPTLKKSLEFHHARDAEENEKTTLSSDQSINLRALWAAEFYTPSDADALAKSLKKLGWNKEGSSEDSAEWLEKSRGNIFGGGWRNLGTLVSLDRQSVFGFNVRKLDLPPHVEYATVQLFNLTSSITCIVVCFVYQESFSVAYDEILKRSYKTFAKKLKRGYSYHTPTFQKRDTVLDFRSGLRRDAKNWFSVHLPGTFCREDSPNDNFSTCEFLTIKNEEPFSKTGVRATSHDWLSILGLNRYWDAWTSCKISGLKFGELDASRDGDRFHTTLTISEDSLNKIDMTSYSGHTTSGYIAFFDHKIGELFSRWACLSLISLHEKKLTRIRDSEMYKKSNKRALEFLNSVRSLVTESVDIATFSPELIEFSRRKLFCHYDGDQFKGIEHLNKQSAPADLIDSLSQTIQERVKKLLAADRSIKDLIIQQGNLLSTVENIKLQRLMEKLTAIMLIFTAITTYDVVEKRYSAQQTVSSVTTSSESHVPSPAHSQALPRSQKLKAK